MLIDFSNCPLSGRVYGGSEKKIGIIYRNTIYMLKFQKNSEFGLCYNHISEYLGSHIFKCIGFNVHETFLGTYKRENVVACKDFMTGLNDETFVPFNEVGESTLETDRENYQYSYQDIMKMSEDNRKLTKVDETIDEFFRIYIVDALIGNLDRHGANWGFLKKDDKYRLAPVFDNGSCMYPKMNNDERMNEIMLSEKETDDRIFTFPTSQIKLHGKKSSYYEVISSMEFEECNRALAYIVPRINLEEYNVIIDELQISKVHKEFYKFMLKKRFEEILLKSFRKL